MNAKTVFTLLVVFLLATLAVTNGRSAAMAESTAVGAGSFLFQNEEVVFSFNAMSSGGTGGKGTAQFDYLGSQTTVLVKLNCVKIVGSELVASGKVVETSDPDFPKNANVIFGAIDGSLSPIPFFVDRITPLFVRNPGINCNDGLPLPQLVPEEGGVVITL